jgi:hypothetical protein
MVSEGLYIIQTNLSVEWCQKWILDTFADMKILIFWSRHPTVFDYKYTPVFVVKVFGGTMFGWQNNDSPVS